MQPEPEAAFAGGAAPRTNAMPQARAAAMRSTRNFTIPPSPRGFGACPRLRREYEPAAITWSRILYRRGHYPSSREHARLGLVQRPADTRARAGGDLRALVAVRRSARSAGEPGVLRRDGRGHPSRRHPRPPWGAARVPERLPAPRIGGRRGRGKPRDAPVPVPRLDVRPRRPARRGTARRPRGWGGRGGARAASRGGRNVGAVRVRVPGS